MSHIFQSNDVALLSIFFYRFTNAFSPIVVSIQRQEKKEKKLNRSVNKMYGIFVVSEVDI